MPYRKMTPEETREWLGAGLVMPVAARKVPDSGSLEPETELVQTDLTQLEHDRLIAEQTPAKRLAMNKGLGALARSKLGWR